MRSMPSHEYTDTLDIRSKPDPRANSRKRKYSPGNRLDQLTVYTFAAVALMFLTAAALGVSW